MAELLSAAGPIWLRSVSQGNEATPFLSAWDAVEMSPFFRHEGQYDGSGPDQDVCWLAPHAQEWELFEAMPLQGEFVSLRSLHFNKLLCAQRLAPDVWAASQMPAGAPPSDDVCTEWRVVLYRENSSVALQNSKSGLFLSAQAHNKRENSPTGGSRHDGESCVLADAPSYLSNRSMHFGVHLVAAVDCTEMWHPLARGKGAKAPIIVPHFGQPVETHNALDA